MLNVAIKEAVELHFADRLAAPPEIHQDALLLNLDNGVAMELRFASPEEYAIVWHWGDASMRIDTAPLHRDLPSFPNHFHDAANNIRADALTHPGKAPWDNVCTVLDAVLSDPLLQNE